MLLNLLRIEIQQKQHNREKRKTKIYKKILKNNFKRIKLSASCGPKKSLIVYFVEYSVPNPHGGNSVIIQYAAILRYIIIFLIYFLF